MVKKLFLPLVLVSGFMTSVHGGLPQTQEDFYHYIQELISSGGNVNQPIMNNVGLQTTLLHEAAYFGYGDSVWLLVSNRADVNALDSKQQTPLHLAALGNHAGIVRLLINCRADVNAKDVGNNTPTANTCELEIDENSLASAQMLIRAHADVNAQNVDGSTPLHLALMAQEIDEGTTASMIELLLDANADINRTDNDGDTCLHIALIDCSSKIVELLLKNYANPNSKDNNGNTPLHKACALGKIKKVQCFLAHGADITVTNNNRQTLLMALLQKSSFMGYRGDYDYLRQKKYTTLVYSFLMDTLTNVDVYDSSYNTLLHYGALYEDSYTCETLALLIRTARHLINAQNINGFTPLYNALGKSNIPATIMLLQSGANPEIRNNQGITPLGYLLSETDVTSVDKLKLARLLVFYGSVIDPYLLYAKDNRSVSLDKLPYGAHEKIVGIDRNFIESLKNREHLARCSTEIIRSYSLNHHGIRQISPLNQLIRNREITGRWQPRQGKKHQSKRLPKESL